VDDGDLVPAGVAGAVVAGARAAIGARGAGARRHGGDNASSIGSSASGWALESENSEAEAGAFLGNATESMEKIPGMEGLKYPFRPQAPAARRQLDSSPAREHDELA